MTPERMQFHLQVVQPLEAKLLALPLGRLFTGELYDLDDTPIGGMDVPDLGEHGLRLSAADVGRLFMAPDDSNITALQLAARDDGTPAGFTVRSQNDFNQAGAPVDIVAYRDLLGDGVRIDALYLSRIMLRADAPERLCTVAFGLQACTAYRHDFAEVTLYAAGKGYGGVALDEDDLVGYQVWPKFGFDAPLEPADLQQDARFAACRSVQDVVAIDRLWWDAWGRPMEMRFDLAPNSRSWQVLVDYLNHVFPGV